MRHFSVTYATNGSTVLAGGYPRPHIKLPACTRPCPGCVPSARHSIRSQSTCCKTLREKMCELGTTIETKLDALIGVDFEA